MARKVKIPDFISTPRDPGWKNISYPVKEATNQEVWNALKRTKKKKV